MEVNNITAPLVQFDLISHKKPLHCKCCGFKTGKELRGAYKYGPYEYVCEKCHDYEFVWYEDKNILEFGLEPFEMGEISILDNPQTKELKTFLSNVFLW